MGLTQFWRIRCSECTNWEQKEGNKIESIRTFKKDGWKKIEKDWLCPDCAKKTPQFYSGKDGEDKGEKI